jgi:uncharacterized protein (DUF2141 family)/uncharacterized membrane protein
MEILFKPLLALHIAGGTSALVAGAVAMIARKGGRNHGIAGIIYFWSMAAVCSSAVGMCILHPQQFLFYVAIFSFYLTFSGRRIAARKRVDARAARLDWTAAIVAAIGGSIMLTRGMMALVQGMDFGAVGMTFGVLCAMFAVRDMRSFVQPPAEKMHWFFTHLTRMLGAYISTFTAFVVVNVKFLPPLVVWLAPTVIGTIGIFVWVTYYAKKFGLQPPKLVLLFQRIIGSTPLPILLGSLLLAASSLFAQVPQNSAQANKPNDTCSVRLVIKNLRSSNGKLMVKLQNAEGTSVQRAAVPIRNNAVDYLFERVPAGKYALQMFHDENGNGQMERNFLGLPTEGYGFSNNAKATFGPPPFDKLLFNCAAQTTQNVSIVY